MAGSPYETIFDNIGRDSISSVLEEYMTNINSVEVNGLVLGSPDCKELSELSPEFRNKINLFCYDFSSGQSDKSSFKNFYFKQGNVFHQGIDDLYSGRIDFVLNRWFLHHCTTKEKRIVFDIADSVLVENGLHVIVDWFIPDYDVDEDTGMADKDSLWKSYNLYFDYQAKFDLKPADWRVERTFNEFENSGGRGGKFFSTEKIEELIDDYSYEYQKHSLHDPDTVDNPELFGQFLYKCHKKN